MALVLRRQSHHPTTAAASKQGAAAIGTTAAAAATTVAPECIRLPQKTGTMLTLGRATTCTVTILSPFISREHATLERREDTRCLLRVQGQNGCLVNHVRVGQAMLRPGDLLHLGGCRPDVKVGDRVAIPATDLAYCLVLEAEQAEAISNGQAEASCQASGNGVAAADLPLAAPPPLLTQPLGRANSAPAAPPTVPTRPEPLPQLPAPAAPGLIEAMQEKMREVWTCPICFDLLASPVTTRPCGHGFCRGCLADWIARSQLCPSCNHAIDFVTDTDYATSQAIDVVVQALPAKERDDYRTRCEAARSVELPTALSTPALRPAAPAARPAARPTPAARPAAPALRPAARPTPAARPAAPTTRPTPRAATALPNARVSHVAAHAARVAPTAAALLPAGRIGWWVAEADDQHCLKPCTACRGTIRRNSLIFLSPRGANGVALPAHPPFTITPAYTQAHTHTHTRMHSLPTLGRGWSWHLPQGNPIMVSAALPWRWLRASLALGSSTFRRHTRRVRPGQGTFLPFPGLSDLGGGGGC
jgi:hypothetical protein